MSGRAAARWAAAALCVAGASDADLVGVEDRLDFSMPESWAMAYTASAFAPSQARAPEDEPCGSALVGADAVYWRRLSTREQQVGFDGASHESMNRSPLLGDARAEVGLPAEVEAALTWTPPVDVRGVRADVVALALRRPLWRGERWRLDARASAVLGHLSGDITSDRDTANSRPGSPGNPLGTDGESHDFLNWRAVGAAALATYAVDGRGSAVFAGPEASYLSATFHVRAEEFGVVDRTVDATHGATWGGIAGGSARLAASVILGAAFEYVPLRIARPGTRTANDPFATGRLSLTVRL